MSDSDKTPEENHTSSTQKPSRDGKAKSAAKQDRLADALRANLRRRKAADRKDEDG